MGGNICSGFPGGLEIVQNLCAKAWISAHDGDKDTSGFANAKIKIEKFPREEVESVISPRSEKFPHRREGTEAVILGSGEEITLSNVMDFGLPRDESETKGYGSQKAPKDDHSQRDSEDTPKKKSADLAESMDSGVAN